MIFYKVPQYIKHFTIFNVCPRFCYTDCVINFFYFVSCTFLLTRFVLLFKNFYFVNGTLSKSCNNINNICIFFFIGHQISVTNFIQNSLRLRLVPTKLVNPFTYFLLFCTLQFVMVCIVYDSQ